MIATEHFLSSQDAPTVDIVIVNWNAGQMLHDCLQSVQRFGTPQVNQVIVIDNGSHDGSMKYVAGFQNVKAILAGENLGFAMACNQAARQGGGEFVLFLNPDAALHAHSLGEALSFMTKPENFSIGICGLQLIDSSGSVSRSCSHFPNPLRYIAHAFGLPVFFPSLGHPMRDWAHDTSRDVDQLIGAFYLVRRRLFEGLGGFDERFFVYFEEVDFSRRATDAGWRSHFLATASAFHVGGGTSRQVKARRLFYSLRSRLIYAFKHFGKPSAVIVFLATLLIEPLTRLAYAALRGSVTSIRETLSGYGLLLRWLPRWVLKGETR